MKRNTTNPSQKSVVLQSSVKPSLTEDSRTTDSGYKVCQSGRG